MLEETILREKEGNGLGKDAQGASMASVKHSFFFKK